MAAEWRVLWQRRDWPEPRCIEAHSRGDAETLARRVAASAPTFQAGPVTFVTVENRLVSPWSLHRVVFADQHGGRPPMAVNDPGAPDTEHPAD